MNMNYKFALITDEKSFSTDTGYRVLTYGSAWDNMGWTALKDLSVQGAKLMAEVLASEGYVIARDREQLKRAMKEAQEIELRKQLRSVSSPKEQLDAENAQIDAEVAKCRYCKTARTRNVKQDAMCRKHREAYRLAYVTSPVSEAYWAN